MWRSLAKWLLTKIAPILIKEAVEKLEGDTKPQ